MDSTSEPATFSFVQLEYPGTFGPADGRYVLRDHAGEDARHIVVIGRREGKPAWIRRSRRPRNAEPEPTEPEIPATRFTVIGAQPLDGDAGERWLREHQGEVQREDLLAEAVGILNQVLHVHATVLATQGGGQLDASAALIARIGFGIGEEVADGRWTEAVEVLPRATSRRQRRSAALRPQERVAAVLGGRDVLLACETLSLRARADLDAGREREAAMQAHLALESAVSELPAWRELNGLERRIGELEELRDGLAEAANVALQGGLDAETRETVDSSLRRVEAALRARTSAATF